MKIKVQTNGFARRLGLTQGNTKEKGKMGHYYLVHKGRGWKCAFYSIKNSGLSFRKYSEWNIIFPQFRKEGQFRELYPIFLIFLKLPVKFPFYLPLFQRFRNCWLKGKLPKIVQQRKSRTLMHPKPMKNNALLVILYHCFRPIGYQGFICNFSDIGELNLVEL